MNGAVYIDAHGTKVGHRDGRLTLKRPGGEEAEIPVEQVERLFVCGHAHFSHDAIAALLQRGIPAVFSSARGGYRGVLLGSQGRQVLRRIGQLDAARDKDRCIAIAVALLQAKLRGQGRLLHQWGAPGRHDIAIELLASHACVDIDVLRGHEGAAARAFFAGLRHHLGGSAFVFVRREQHPPPDPVNAVLSLAYTLLTNEVEVAVAASGLDPCVGFLHATADGRPALLMDLIEPLRPLADRFVAGLLRHELTPDDFDDGEKGCRLRDGRRGIFYRAWEKLLGESIAWRGETTNWRRLIHQQAMVLAHHLEDPTQKASFWHLDAH